MEIVQRYEIETGNAYLIDYGDGNHEIICEKGLYDGTLLEGLKKSGYKILGYHGNILMPDGTNIKDITVTDTQLSATELRHAMEMEDIALTEAEASIYFDREVEIKELEFKEPKVEISTREELVAYLRNQDRLSRLRAGERDIRPLNSFVSKEALFTIKEVCSKDPVVLECLGIIERRRRLNTYMEYEKLVKFLQNMGVLASEYTADAVKDAYLSWGVCGLNLHVTKSTIKVGVDVPIYVSSENISEKDRVLDVSIEWAVLDRKGNVHYKDTTVNWVEAEYDDFMGVDIKPSDVDGYKRLVASANEWKTEYQPIRCMVTKRHNRSYLSALDDDGATFTVRVDHDKMVIVDSRLDTIINSSYLLVKGIDDEWCLLTSCIRKKDYIEQGLARIKAYEIRRNRTRNCPVENSYDLAIKGGLNPRAALGYLGLLAKEDKESGQIIPYDKAAKLFYEFPGSELYPKKESLYSFLLKKYNPEGQSYNTMSELIDIMSDTKSTLVDSNQYLVGAEYDDTMDFAAQSEKIERPIDILEFARDVRSGERSVGEYNNGLLNENRVPIYECQNFVLTVAYILSRNKSNVVYEYGEGNGTISNILEGIENTDIIDFNIVFRYNDSKYMGYLYDTLRMNGKRADDCLHAVMVTRIFREASNMSIEDQRHYAMQMLSLPMSKSNYKGRVNRPAYETLKGVIQQAITDYNARRGLPVKFYNALLAGAGAYALNLAFGIQLNKISPENIGIGGGFIYKIDLPENIEIKVDVPKSVVDHFKNTGNFAQECFITLFDWCTFEFLNGKFNLFCLNARITPWEVKPFSGKVPTYNWIINDLLIEGIANEKARNGILADSKTKVMTYSLDNGSLKDVGDDGSYLILKYADTSSQQIDDDNVFGMVNATRSAYMKYLDYKKNNFTDLDTLDEEFVGEDTDEFPEIYTKRFLLHNVFAKRENKCLLMIPLASDLYFKEDYKMLCTKPGCTEPVFAEYDAERRQNFVTQYQVGIVAGGTSDDTVLINSNTGRLSRFKLIEQNYSELKMWTKLIGADWYPKAECIVIGDKFRVISMETHAQVDFKASDVTKAQLDKLAAKEMVYQLSSRKYLIRAMSGDFTLEV